MSSSGYGGGANNHQYGNGWTPQYRSNAVTAQPGSAYDTNLHRFSQSGNHYSSSFNGQPSGLYSSSTPSATQSDVRSQPVNHPQTGYAPRQPDNSNQYRSSQLPSPSYNHGQSQARPVYQPNSHTNNTGQSSSQYRLSGGAQQQHHGQSNQREGAQSRSQGAQRYQDNASPTPIAYQKPPPRNLHSASPAAYQERARAHQQSYQSSSTHANESSAPQTVDPSQFHDSYVEQQRKRAEEAHAQEVARRREEEAAAAAQERERQRQHEEQERRKAEESRKAGEVRRKALEAEVAAQQAEAAKQAQEAAKRAKDAAPKKKRGPYKSKKAAAAKAALEGDRSAEFKALFEKMRELHALDPEMMSKMWDEERQHHLAQEAATASSPQQSPAVAAPTPSSSGASKPAGTKATPKGKSPKGKLAARIPNSAQAPTKKSSVKSTPVSNERQASSGPSVTPSAAVTTAIPGIQAAVASPGLKAPTSAASTSAMESAPKPKPNPEVLAEKKRILSIAASRLIEQTPENHGRTIPPAEISTLLSGNLHFTDLCESVEKRGFIINRGAFARGLIAAEHDFKPKQTAAPTTGGKVIRDASQASPAPATALTPTTGNASLLPPLSATSRATETSAEPESVKGSPKPQKPTKASAKAKAPPHPVPQTKEDLARKRTFAELVDLTELSDDEMPEKRMRNDIPDPFPMPESLSTSALAAAPVTASATDPAPRMPPSAKPSMADKRMPAIPIDHPLHTIKGFELLDRRNALRRSKYNSKTIARDILLATGRHPNLRPLNVHLEILKTSGLLVKDEADLGTLRWDLIDPGGLPLGSGMANEPDIIEVEDFADDEGNNSDSDVDVLKPNHGGGGSATIGPTAVSTASAPRFPPNAPTPKKSTNPMSSAPPSSAAASSTPQQHRSHATPRQNASGSTHQQQRTHVTPRQNASGSTPQSSGASSYAQLHAMNEQSGMQRRRGRPVGWRKHMQKDGGSSDPKPPNQKKPTSPPEPVFAAFKCEWDGCKASLQNLDTLRRHVFKMHAIPRDGQYVCNWDSCGRIELVHDGPRTTSRKVRNYYSSAREWSEHVDRTHMTAVAWRLGDGPSAGLADPAGSASEHSDAYLSDRDGRQVTPTVDMPTTARGFIAVNTPRSGRRTNLERAQDELRAAEQRRARVGVGIDHGGARSVDDAMRATMQDDSDGVPEPVNEADMMD